MEGWSWRWMLAAMLCFALGVALMVWLQMPQNLPIRQISLHGEFQYAKKAELEEIIVKTVDGNLVTQDLTLLEQRLAEYPWLRHARVRRDWPDTLQVHVYEQVPVAHWEAGGLLNSDGELFAPRQTGEWDLLHLSGEPGRGPALIKLAAKVRRMLAPHGLELRKLIESRHRVVTLHVSPKLELVLGRTRPLQHLARWLRYRTAYEQHSARPAAVIDLRYPNGFAVRLATQS